MKCLDDIISHHNAALMEIHQHPEDVREFISFLDAYLPCWPVGHLFDTKLQDVMVTTAQDLNQFMAHLIPMLRGQRTQILPSWGKDTPCLKWDRFDCFIPTATGGWDVGDWKRKVIQWNREETKNLFTSGTFSDKILAMKSPTFNPQWMEDWLND